MGVDSVSARGTTAKCVDCGEEFVRTRATSLRCPKCQQERIHALRKASKKRCRVKANAAKAKAAAIGKVCPYCGKPTPNEVYCDLCIEQGFDNLHKELGITNGWDKPKKQKIPLVPGNRGFIPTGAINIAKANRVSTTPVEIIQTRKRRHWSATQP